ncbi:MAG: ComEC/Rec2 family competence protein [Cyanobacteria bacterium P01_F01_bin.42]
MLYGSAVLIYLAFILGLLLSGLAWGGLVVLLLGLFIAILRWGTPMPLLRRGPRASFWIFLGLVGLLASFYIQWRLPQPTAADVSRTVTQLSPNQPTALYVLEGTVESLPRRTRSGRSQIWLEATSVGLATEPQNQDLKSTQGRVYTTLSQADEVDLHPGQTVKLIGRIYQPSPQTNPAGFDFESWLARQNAFAGMKAESVEVLRSPDEFGLWKVKRRILESQQAWLKEPVGPLIGAMVLGNRAVDLPFKTQDAFIQVGLAHALAASGFQISLILTCLLSLVRWAPRSVQFIAGSMALLGFLGLSGIEASVLRAVLMGLAGLIALVLGRKMKPIPILICIAFGMLVFQPLWIWDLGFQLSFLATLGLIVTVPPLQQRLDWMPAAAASLIAVPLAAMVWTLPLQLHSFGVVPVYALLANVFTTPFISLVTLGSFVSGIVGFFLPPAGSAITYMVGIPAHVLIWIVDQFNRLPGKLWAVGSISGWQVALIYGAILLVWLVPTFRMRWKLVLACGVFTMLAPIWSAQGQLSQLTVFDAVNAPVMVIQQPHSTVLVNTGNEQSALGTVLPFLQHQGINRVDIAIATDLRQSSQSAWQAMQKRITLRTFSPVSTQNPQSLQDKMLTSSRKMRWQPLLPNQTARAEQAVVKVLRNSSAVLEFQLGSLTGLMVANANEDGLSTWLSGLELPPIQALWITSARWNPDVIAQIEPEVVILSHPDASPEAIASLKAQDCTIYWTKRDGAIQWEQAHGFSHILSPSDIKSPLL